MRKSFNTSIEEEIQNNFKSACAKEGVPMNTVLEKLMKAYYENDIEIIVRQNSSLEIKK